MSVNPAGAVSLGSVTAPSHVISLKPQPTTRRVSSQAQHSAFVSAKPQSASDDHIGTVLDVKL